MPLSRVMVVCHIVVMVRPLLFFYFFTAVNIDTIIEKENHPVDQKGRSRVVLLRSLGYSCSAPEYVAVCSNQQSNVIIIIMAGICPNRDTVEGEQ